MSWPQAQYVIDELSKKFEDSSGGGAKIPPKAMAACSAVAGNTQAILSWTLPENTEVDGTALVTVAGLVIVRKEGSAPADQNDGTQVLTSADKTGTYTDTGLTNGAEYFYGFFPFSTANVYNVSQNNVVSVIPSAVKIWGFRQNFDNKSTANDGTGTITYNTADEIENKDFSPMMTNEGTGTATAGSWLSFLTDVLKNQPYMVKSTGEVDYALNPNDYTKKKDGTPSDYKNTSYAGGAFSWINKIWMKEVYASDNSYRDVYFANGALDGYLPVGFIDSDNNELEGLWIPMGYMDANGKTLVAGTTPIAEHTCDQENAIIVAFSPRARHFGGPIANVLRDLEFMLFRSTDVPKYAGYGRCNAGGNAVIANNVVANGVVPGFKGTADKTSLNKYFHSQLLGSYQQWSRDPFTLLVNGAFKYSTNYTYDISGAKYKTSDKTSWGSLNGGWHYATHMEYTGDGYGSTPKKENTGSTSTGIPDGLYCNTSGVRVAVRFGYCSNDLIGGPATLTLNNEASYAYWSNGVGVLLLPPKGHSPQA